MKGNVNDILTDAKVKEVVSKATERMELLLAAVIIVLFVGFLTLLLSVASPIIDAWRFKAATYQDLRDQILEQKASIQTQGEKIDNLDSRLERIYGF